MNAAPRDPARLPQWPFVGVVALLVVLILLTPTLSSSSAGSLTTTPELVVDRAPGSNDSVFYVTSLSVSTRYSTIAIGLLDGLPWPYHGTLTGLSGWNWTNATDVLVLSTSTTANPVAVNVSVKYVDPSGAVAVYAGAFAFYLNSTSTQFVTLTLLVGATGPTVLTPVADLPIYLTLTRQAGSRT